MTYEEAASQVTTGTAIHHPDMGKGGVIARILGYGDAVAGKLWCINPHTGSNYLFTPTEAEKARTDWAILKPE